MPETSVRLSEEHRDLIQDVADQLDTSIKSVVGMILEWFFDTDWGNPDVIARLGVEDEAEEEDDDDDNDDNGDNDDDDEDEEEEEDDDVVETTRMSRST